MKIGMIIDLERDAEEAAIALRARLVQMRGMRLGREKALRIAQQERAARQRATMAYRLLMEAEDLELHKDRAPGPVVRIQKRLASIGQRRVWAVWSGDLPVAILAKFDGCWQAFDLVSGEVQDAMSVADAKRIGGGIAHKKWIEVDSCAKGGGEKTG